MAKIIAIHNLGGLSETTAIGETASECMKDLAQHLGESQEDFFEDVTFFQGSEVEFVQATTYTLK
jgi:hypothetical protein